MLDFLLPAKRQKHFPLASFPGHFHLQYLIAYSMQIWRRKAWEIWSHAVTSGRQKINTQDGGGGGEGREPREV